MAANPKHGYSLLRDLLNTTMPWNVSRLGAHHLISTGRGDFFLGGGERNEKKKKRQGKKEIKERKRKERERKRKNLHPSEE